jgi:acetate kinase
VSSAILALNAGSSTVKFAAYAVDAMRLAPAPLIRETLQGSAMPLNAAWPRIVAALAGRRLAGVGHRIVHGGSRFAAPIAIDAGVERELEELIPLAPLHQPHGIALIDPSRRLAPGATQVACFDTAFHRTMPEVARMFALPAELTASGVRPYGFHGLSYEYIASRLPGIAVGRALGRVIIAHLGNGSSLCALRDLESVATTMTFTPLDGVPMATRSGSLDPGVVLYLLAERGMSAAELDTLLNHRSGLLGVSGVSGDVQELMASTEPRAALALALLVYRVGREIGSLTAALGGLDALVFTGGIGEHAGALRQRICETAAWAGVAIDPARNEGPGPRISTDASRVSVWVIPTDEEAVIARHTLSVLASR